MSNSIANNPRDGGESLRLEDKGGGAREGRRMDRERMVANSPPPAKSWRLDSILLRCGAVFIG
jgi:hypothetical protein